MERKELEELKEQGKDAALGSFTKFPDILMMDGGKGQVNVALRVLDHLGLDIPVCGMVKDDDHRTRGLYYNNEEIIFAPNSEAFLLVTRIQDEAHRFAIEYHRSLRAKGQVHSVLDDIKGVGPKRRKELMKYFKDLGQNQDSNSYGTFKCSWHESKYCRVYLWVFFTIPSSKEIC